MKLDRLDLKIIDILQRDGRITNLELAEKVGLSPTPCLNRVKKMEAAGIISGYAAIIDPIAAGYEICAFILVQINNHTRKAGDEFAAAVSKSPAIVEYNMISGKLDYLLRVYARNLSHYEVILQDQISELPHIASLESLFVLNTSSQPRMKLSLENSPLLQPKR
ncbi:MAG: Lrp/AsnC family transcriptional regulator [Parvularculaceae bacterium]